MTLSRQLRVFLLYARGDKDAVHCLYRRIGKAGANAWMDVEKIFPGQDWEYEIRKAIHHSDIVIVCLSRGFIKQGLSPRRSCGSHLKEPIHSLRTVNIHYPCPVGEV